jgi:hypothetical protein
MQKFFWIKHLIYSSGYLPILVKQKLMKKINMSSVPSNVIRHGVVCSATDNVSTLLYDSCNQFCNLIFYKIFCVPNFSNFQLSISKLIDESKE